MSGAHYLLQVNIYLIVFYGFYRLLLDRETYFNLNRSYLLSAGLFSLLIPFIQIDWFSAQPVTQNVSVSVSQLYMTGIVDNTEASFNWGHLIALIYMSGAIIFLAKFILQLLSIRKHLQNTPEGTAFSFFNKLSIHHALPGQDVISKHEEIHIRQLHSVDVLFFELLGIITWFNPVIYFYKYSIKNIHEYLADEEAANYQGDKEQYAFLLLSKAFGVSPNALTNSFFNKSLIKKRIFMLHKQKSRRTAILKYGLFLPLFALMLILSSATIRKNDNIRAAAANIPLNNPLIVVKEVLPHKTTEPVTRSQKSTSAYDTTKITEWTAFYNYLERNIRYPKDAQENNIQGNSQITFRINNGAVDGLNTFAKLGYGCDAQVMRNILGFTGFKDIKDGKYLLNVAFRLNGSAAAIVNSNVQPATDITVLNPITVVGYTQEAAIAATNNTGEIHDFVSVDKAPMFPGGMNEFYAYINKNIHYPEEAIQDKIEGKVFLSFIVEKNGELSDIKVDRGLGGGINEEAIRILKESPRWVAGTLNNKPVRVKYNIPIGFSLSKNTSTAPKATGTAGSGKPEQAVVVRKTNPVSGITATGKNGANPDYIIDGVKVSSEAMKNLDPKTIESIDVIKASTAVIRGGKVNKNGLVIVKTKTPKIEVTPIK